MSSKMLLFIIVQITAILASPKILIPGQPKAPNKGWVAPGSLPVAPGSLPVATGSLPVAPVLPPFQDWIAPGPLTAPIKLPPSLIEQWIAVQKLLLALKEKGQKIEVFSNSMKSVLTSKNTSECILFLNDTRGAGQGFITVVLEQFAENFTNFLSDLVEALSMIIDSIVSNSVGRRNLAMYRVLQEQGMMSQERPL